MARRIGLGRGLNALLDNNDDDSSNISIQDDTAPETKISPAAAAKNKTGDIVKLPIDKLVPNPGQPRKNFNETELQELAESIKTYGIIQPVIAANAGDGTYIIIAGERRTRAAKLARLDTVPAIIRDYTDQKRLEVSLIENIQRSDLNPIEEAAAYKNLMDFSNLSQDELAVRMGKNRSTVANALRLLKLPIEVQKNIEDGKVSSGHARALLSVTDIKSREKLFREILTGDVSVREAEKRAAELNESSGNKKGKESGIKSGKGKKQPPEIGAMEEKFIGRLGTKVTIEGDLNKGRIHIEYYSMEDLERLYEILGG
ncbi:MAG: ParB/RepB/Spo0J family partition protein [Treponema sp.]|nr:ParB/RepB/Spo0J family partition protein [Treponema sp.]